jgi:hypothetical protein
VASKASQSERGLENMGRMLKESITHTQSPEEAPRKEPATEAPPEIPPSTRLRERKKVVRKSKPKITRDPQIASDPYITGKEKYRVDVQQLMRLKIEYDVEKEHTESERATDFLVAPHLIVVTRPLPQPVAVLAWMNGPGVWVPPKLGVALGST